MPAWAGSSPTIEETRADALSAEHELSALQHRIHETETALSRAEHRVEMSRSQIASLNDQRSRDMADREYLQQETARVAEQKIRARRREPAPAGTHDRTRRTRCWANRTVTWNHWPGAAGKGNFPG